MTRRPLVLGAVLIGVGDAGGAHLWRHPDVPTTASVDIDWYIRQAREAEASHFDFVFIVDSQFIDAGFPPHHLNRLEPLTLLSAVAVSTERIGLVATVSTTYSEPWDIARRVASLDQISRGRAAWNIVTSQDPGTAGNFSRTKHGDYATRYRRARESVDVVTGLWQSYEEDAFSTDKTAERFLDPSKQHALNHVGEFFSVTGPLNIQRSAQGQPVLIQAGTSDDGRNLSAEVADIVFSFEPTVEAAAALRSDILKRAEKYDRNPDEVLFVPGVTVVVRDTDAQAHLAVEEARARVPIERLLAQVQRLFGGRSFARFDLDEPFPNIDPRTPESLAGATVLADRASTEGWSLRQALHSLVDHWAVFAGSPSTVADEVARWYYSGAVDGFNVFVQDPGDWLRFRTEVVPILVERGIARADYGSDTLRGHLGLSVPTNAYSAT
ncbi:LLM class flavin-dependent oxidoreductase [Rhodococcus sp. 06-156-3C]|uniref:NtaA/DmoA family FMN-dependent monooxygenase n=1 Tax=Nocardiaceae TaxID=85025 RepID=UPI000522E791|nr:MULTISPECIES: NtaA/DmoA family FMN-dependent monooxygenase [Rhodococcus]OZD11074.1 LLM class flavin-dependent oxidoreductase [Rhodococcus sp. 06-156-4C]OZD14490.1 LLM class flavin-dependent oxidoreductase [Rhodococcus sp. 06-156-4a]OZD24824.1 LLM class flavin-dependent oxidoreductase [Rhodococcus sp. 06-156-3C]OZD27798.1 LLM class flavin-dependent oxidoreductase [Rhodococcus sp. 06-156-3b]OZD39779.1 LLM class flavin-dependent oxidoreductase [Rhodococcus sp. 06-156-3]